MEKIYIAGQYFKVLIEAEREGLHFALIENLGINNLCGTPQSLKLLEACPSELEALNRKGGYYLLWGPINDKPDYPCHGISLLRADRKWPLEKAMQEFFQIVKNSEKQSFIFKDNY